MLRLLQWNCQSLRNKVPELEYRSRDYDIILLSETWLNHEHRINLRNFDIVREDRILGVGGGVAILIRNNIKYRQIPVTANYNGILEACAVEVTWRDKPLILVSLYKPP